MTSLGPGTKWLDQDYHKTRFKSNEEQIKKLRINFKCRGWKDLLEKTSMLATYSRKIFLRQLKAASK